ncbi:MAG: Xaa-Pro peptidase family protein [Muribaculaceae bacterium]|nr:Xaa-Pro peptidase family protein [Muribaculaceae bacterium]
MEQNRFMSPEMKEETGRRIEALQRLMKDSAYGEPSALLIGSNANLFYASGRFFRGYVYVPAQGEAIYFLIRPTVFGEAPNIRYIRKPEMIGDLLNEMNLKLPEAIGLEEDELSYSDITRLRKCFPESKVVNVSALLRRGRMVKTPYEIAEMKKDGLHQAAVYHKIPGLYKPDMTDLEFQIEIEHELRLEGCLGYIRTAGNLMEINMGSVVNGNNADAPSPYDFSMGGAGVDPSLPVGADGSIMHNGTTVMVDMNGSFNGYQTDMTRVWSIGEIPPLAMKAHECSRRILRELEQSVRPGMEICELYKRSIAIVEEEGLEKYFMGHRQQAGFIGHGVGIELNEQPPITGRNRQQVLENMTLAIEPKFVIPGVGAVGVENTYVVRKEGLECITPFPEEIENLL